MSSDKVAATFHPEDVPTPCTICFSREHGTADHDLPPWLHQDLRDRGNR